MQVERGHILTQDANMLLTLRYTEKLLKMEQKVFKQISKDIEPQCIKVSADVYEKFGPNLPRAREKMKNIVVLDSEGLSASQAREKQKLQKCKQRNGGFC